MTETLSSANTYKLPNQDEFKSVDAQELGPRALAHLLESTRVAIIRDDEAVREPRQDGVLRYPPVRVELEADPEQIDKYVNMPPTDLSFWSGDAKR